MTASPTTAVAMRAIAAAWLGDTPCDLAPLAGQGFSGMPVWGVQAATGRFVLKAFPSGASRDRAAWVHRLMLHLRAAGCVTVPALQQTPAGTTLVAAGGRLWELVDFVDGNATPRPSAAQAKAALQALARAHVTAASFSEPGPHGASGLAKRIGRARVLLAEPWRARLDRLPVPPSNALALGMHERLARAVVSFEAAEGGRRLAAFSRWHPPPLAAQPVFRDLWADHVFFGRGQLALVSGFIDLHAAGVDTPATDVARLLGSWTSPWPGSGSWVTRWEAAIAAYDGVRPLAVEERKALPLLHASAVVFGLDNWFRWILEEGRSFPVAAALERVDWLLNGLPAALQELSPDGRVTGSSVV